MFTYNRARSQLSKLFAIIRNLKRKLELFVKLGCKRLIRKIEIQIVYLEIEIETLEGEEVLTPSEVQLRRTDDWAALEYEAWNDSKFLGRIVVLTKQFIAYSNQGEWQAFKNIYSASLFLAIA